jgi:hypothetical protein
MPEENPKPLSTMYWPLRHHLPLDGTPPMEKRWISEEYHWKSHPAEGFMVSHDKAEDHDGVQTVVFSRLWVETGEGTWPRTGTTSTLERLIIEDLEAKTFQPGDYHYAPRREKAIANEMFGRLAVPRLGHFGTWKQAYQVRVGDVIAAFDGREFEQPLTVAALRTDHSSAYWGPRTHLVWENESRHWPDSYLTELTWVAVAGSAQ